MVRFADDAVLGFERKDDARRMFEVLPKRFGKYAVVHQPAPQRLECLVLAATRTKPIRAVQKVLLVYGFQYHDHRSLEYFILQCRYADGPGLVACSFFGNVDAAYRRRSILSRFEPLEQARQVSLPGWFRIAPP